MPPPASRGAREWARSAKTRDELLEAAGAVFLELGFTDAPIASISSRSGVSVGSIYHHFGGKAELYLALWDRFARSEQAAAKQAVLEAREGGVEDVSELFLIGARASLEHTWAYRLEARMFNSSDRPPGFEARRRSDTRAWIRQNALLLAAEDEPVERLRIKALTSIIADSADEIAHARRRRTANVLIEATLALLRRVAER